jgi:hypothetical protein
MQHWATAGPKAQRFDPTLIGDFIVKHAPQIENALGTIRLSVCIDWLGNASHRPNKEPNLPKYEMSL